jgi:hypothetical protein
MTLASEHKPIHAPAADCRASIDRDLREGLRDMGCCINNERLYLDTVAPRTARSDAEVLPSGVRIERPAAGRAQ